MGIFSHHIKRLSSCCLSPAFLVMLVVAFLLWYITKLGYVYTVELPVTIDVHGDKFNVSCVVEGVGHRLLRYRMQSKHPLSIRPNELKFSSADSLGFSIVDPISLQSAIALRYSDVRVISVEEIPEIMISNISE